jgi:REP element-mobilizing transposase RayT
LYRDLLAEAAEKAGSEIWVYCLMPIHVHMTARYSNGRCG